MATEPTGDRDKATIRRWGEEIWNRGEFSATPDLITPDFVCHRMDGLEAIRGHEAHDRWVADVRERNPGFRVEILDVIAEGNKVASYWRGTGPGMHFYRMEDGKIAEMWAVLDRTGA